jgi:hypothetical protein
MFAATIYTNKPEIPKLGIYQGTLVGDCDMAGDFVKRFSSAQTVTTFNLAAKWLERSIKSLSLDLALLVVADLIN